MTKLRAVHYLNQFFAQIGGEEQADYRPAARAGAVGPGALFEAAFGEQAQIAGSVICGDSYFNERPQTAAAEIIALIQAFEPDFVIAGPAFNAGRYGMACGAVAAAVQESLHIPAVTGMYRENPGADQYRQKTYIIATKNKAAGMKEAVSLMAALALKLARGETIGASKEEGYLPNGVRVNFFEQQRGSQRAVEMLIRKMKGESYHTEYPMPVFDRVQPPPPVTEIQKAKIALVTTGGIVPKGNPDHLESSSATKYGKYALGNLDHLSAAAFETAHGGYDPVYVNEDPDRALPVDILREYEKAAKIGSLHPYFYSTVGNGTSVGNAKAFAEKMARELRADKVDAVILTST